jgi:predicted TIM-barrel fold metal-dependent hydrolase
MKIDIHVHIADLDALLPTGKPAGLPGRVLRRTAAEAMAQPDTDSAGSLNARWMKFLAHRVRESPLDKVVLLALDGVYDESGVPCPDKCILQVDNDFVCAVTARDPAFIFGASIHPYRKDAVAELERVVKIGARLIKWIPSGQHIEPDHPKCKPFYEALAHYGIPLLTHTGVEHTLGCRRTRYNHPKRLEPALECGVKVIAAHCGLHLFLHEPSFFKTWAAMARTHEHFYGDTGACSIMTRIPAMLRILKDGELRRKLLYGSDFPGIPSPWWCWQLGIGKMRLLARRQNPLDRNVRVMQALGMPDAVLEHAHRHLGIA